MISNAGNDCSSNALRCPENFTIAWKWNTINSSSGAHKMMKLQPKYLWPKPTKT